MSLCLLCVVLALLASCNSKPSQQPSTGSAYAGPATLNLRKDLGAKSAQVGTVKHGDKLEVLDTRRRFVKVRSASGIEGWTEINNLLTEQQMKELRALAAAAAKLPSQGAATVYEPLNVHAEPYRQSPSFFQIPEGGMVDVIGHRVTPHTAPASLNPKPVPVRHAIASKKSTGKKTSLPLVPLPAPPPPPNNWLALSHSDHRPPQSQPSSAASAAPSADDWSLVRTRNGEVGWALARMLAMKIPDEVAQYAERHRITAYLSLGESKDKDTQETKNNWLWTTASASLLPYEFDSFRVFVWSPKRHHYETAYVERNVKGHYPVQTESLPGQDEKEFSLILEDKEGHLNKCTYGFSGYRVRLISKTPYQTPGALAAVLSGTDLVTEAPLAPAPAQIGWSDKLRAWRKKWIGK